MIMIMIMIIVVIIIIITIIMDLSSSSRKWGGGNTYPVGPGRPSSSRPLQRAKRRPSLC
jgi:preprotein translocase subunit SecG